MSERFDQEKNMWQRIQADGSIADTPFKAKKVAENPKKTFITSQLSFTITFSSVICQSSKDFLQANTLLYLVFSRSIFKGHAESLDFNFLLYFLFHIDLAWKVCRKRAISLKKAFAAGHNRANQPFLHRCRPNELRTRVLIDECSRSVSDRDVV